MTKPGVARIRAALLDFYDRHARDLPWRRSSDPYRIWVSEVMLQQTRVDTVRDYYARWMARFPDLERLADADLEEVLSLWQGLGYYARARNLHRAAGLVKERHGGRVPRDPKQLRALPGVGDYTAGAVGSIAFGRAEPAVDGNVKRVLSRLYDLAHPTASDHRERATALVDPERPGDFNQALMELGATICTPRNPACGECPVRDHCLARARGTVGERPAVKAGKPVPHLHLLTVVAALPGGRTLLRRRPEHGLLGGMWEFPAVECDGPPAARFDSSTLRSVTLLQPVDHRFSHLRATYHPVVLALPRPPRRRLRLPTAVAGLANGQRTVELDPAHTRTPTFDELIPMPLPVAQRKIARMAGP